MTASKNQLALEETLQGILSRGGWRTASEVAYEAGGPASDTEETLLNLKDHGSAPVSDVGAALLNLKDHGSAPVSDVEAALLNLKDHGRAIVAVAPVNSKRVFFHAMTPDAQTLAEEHWMTPLTRLPWPLMRSLIEKLEQRHRQGLAGELPEWLRAVMVFENHLDSMNLRDGRPRPELGFPYPCEWRTDHNEGSFNPPLEEYVFLMTFNGVIDQNLTHHLIPDREQQFPFYPPTKRYDPCPMLRLILRAGKLHVELDRVGFATVNRENLKLEQCPTPDRIVSETRERLWEAAESGEMNNDYLTAFQPFPSPLRIRLLSQIVHEGRRRT